MGGIYLAALLCCLYLSSFFDWLVSSAWLGRLPSGTAQIDSNCPPTNFGTHELIQPSCYNIVSRYFHGLLVTR